MFDEVPFSQVRRRIGRGGGIPAFAPRTPTPPSQARSGKNLKTPHWGVFLTVFHLIGSNPTDGNGTIRDPRSNQTGRGGGIRTHTSKMADFKRANRPPSKQQQITDSPAKTASFSDFVNNQKQRQINKLGQFLGQLGNEFFCMKIRVTKKNGSKSDGRKPDHTNTSNRAR